MFFFRVSLSFCSQKLRGIVSVANVPISHLSCFFEKDPIFFINECFIRIEAANDGTGLKMIILTVIPSAYRQSESTLLQKQRIVYEFKRQKYQRKVFRNSTLFLARPVWRVLFGYAPTVDHATSKFLGRTLFTSRETIEVIEGFLIRHLTDTFRKIKNIQVKFCNDDVYANNPILKKSLKDIEVYQSTFPKALSSEEIKFLLDELTVTEDLYIQRKIEDGFKYSTGLRTKKVHIACAHFMTIDAVLNSISHKISLYDCRPEQFTSAELNNFLKTWISKEKMEKLGRFSISLSCKSKFPDEFWTEVLEGIDHERVSAYKVKVSRIDGTTAVLDMARSLFVFFTTAHL